MPTERPGTAVPALFLFAHQDDEFGVFEAVARAARTGAVHCAFFTDGAAGGEPARRDAESRRVLTRLGVPPANVRFFGVARGIADGRLHESLAAVAVALDELLDELPTAQVHLAAWEGGHPDHDALHAVAATLLHERGRLGAARQFPLYHAHRCPGPFFRVLSPLTANGPVTARRLSFGERLRQLRLCLAYPSQRKTWLGLYPFVALRLLLHGRQSLQPLDLQRTLARPHDGRLYYEKRGFLTFDVLQRVLAGWRGQRAPARR